MTGEAPSIMVDPTRAKDMDGPSIDKTATSRLLIGLALCAALMSGAFFLHVRHDAEDHGSPTGASAHMLPGLTLDNASPAGSGIVVTSMESGGQAARLGIAVGDDLIRIDNMPIASLDQASSFLNAHPQPRLVLGLRRQDAIRTVSLDRSKE